MSSKTARVGAGSGEVPSWTLFSRLPVSLPSVALHRLLVQYARQWPDRVWAVEGANGIGRPLAQRLIASGERVVDVPARLAARARVFDTGQGRKTGAADAHSIVMVALRDEGLREVTSDSELTMLRLLCDRPDELSRARAQALNRMHRPLLDLVPGGASVKKSAAQYEKLLASVRPSARCRRGTHQVEIGRVRRLGLGPRVVANCAHRHGLRDIDSALYGSDKTRIRISADREGLGSRQT